MNDISRWLATFLLNAIWQITAIAIFAFVCAKLLHRMPSRYAHRAWVLAMFACLLIPLTTVLIQHSAGTRIDETKRAGSVLNEPLNSSPRGLSLQFRSVSHSISLPPLLSRVLLWAFAVLLLHRAVRLLWLAYRTSCIRQCAYERELPESLSEVAERCLRAFSLSAVPLLCSTEVSSPATVGFRRPVLLLPDTFFTGDLTQDDLSSALSHEFAHVRRRDFVLNLLYEMVYLTVCFHPFAAFMRSRIAHTRELACDEMAVRMLPSGAHYASSLLHIAQSVFSGGQSQSSYALGLFDTNTLEERIVNILKTTNASRKWARPLRLLVVVLVGAAALGISVFSLQLAAENATDLRQFAGTWECKYKGRPFFTLKMAVKDGVLGGTAVHSTRVSWVDGEIIPDTDETTPDKIFDTHASGQELMIKIADGPNDSDPIALSFKLTGKDEAEAKLIVEKQPDAPAQKKPWHFQRVSNAQ
jgi:beta-lactamase regulating signal transducer with metallopeptidase domain